MNAGVVMVVLGALFGMILLVALVGTAVVLVTRRRRRDAPLGHMPSGWLDRRASADPVLDSHRPD